MIRRRRKIPLTVDDIMTTPPLVVSPDENVVKVAKKMLEHEYGSALVTEEDKLVGIITEHDLLYALSEGENGIKLKARDIMTEDPITVKTKTDIMEAIRVMKDANVRHLPVVDERGRPVGVVAFRDILESLLLLIHFFYC
ncbi:histidine kinase [Ignicoccus islandicus DSM 13165]|uniref:Histidine kinase n=1 Tax=Ignicoccus islandicus DSM 13165 TaxID=940295 RepID=A0A0U3DVB9_9CREN|nr:CBS domain-containing protein [Ignicoccus islandicus]ALU11370.1 histidine kinase [Ignicoccus islandicus DSM 13165]